MSETFLYQYQQQPREEFANSLYQHISAEPAFFADLQFSPLTQIGKTLTLMGVTLAFMLTVSPNARTTVFDQVARTK
jgi:hypothetical protein